MAVRKLCRATEGDGDDVELLLGREVGLTLAELAALLGVPLPALPSVVPSSGVLGVTDPEAFLGLELPVAGIAGDQQAALVGNKCLRQGEAKCTYGTGAFLLFCTGEEVVESKAGLLSSVAYQNGPNGKPVYCLEGSSESALPLRRCDG